MTDIMFITLINYIREHGNDIITLSTEEENTPSINTIDTKSKLLVNSGFINEGINKTIYNKDETGLKRFMAQNEYTYTNNLFHKTLKFIKENHFGTFYNSYKLYNSVTKKSIILNNIYDIMIIDSLKNEVFTYFEIYNDDWSIYISMVNNKDTNTKVKEYTKALFEMYFKEPEKDIRKAFIKKYGFDYDIVYPAYIVCIYDYEANYINIDNYIADKVQKLNFDRIDYIERRSKSGIYKTTYNRIIDNYKSLEQTNNNTLDAELFKLIQNELYFEEIQSQLYKWYTLSIFDKHNKTNYKNTKEKSKQQTKAEKEYRNKQIVMFKDEGFTQKEVSDMLQLTLRTVQRYWNW